MKVFELNYVEWEIEESWFFSKSRTSKNTFDKDVNFLIDKYQQEYLEKDIYHSIQDFTKFIASKMIELGYIPITTLKTKISDSTLPELSKIFKEKRDIKSKRDWDERMEKKKSLYRYKLD